MGTHYITHTLHTLTQHSTVVHVEDNAHVPCWTGTCKAHNIRYTSILTDLTLVTHSTVCTYETSHCETFHCEVSHT